MVHEIFGATRKKVVVSMSHTHPHQDLSGERVMHGYLAVQANDRNVVTAIQSNTVSRGDCLGNQPSVV
jgi:hypothetical protein